MDSFDLLLLTILQFQLIHWLSQGQVLEKKIILHASYTSCFSSIRTLLVLTSYHLSISIHASSCGWGLGGVE
jgi:hypothetical protein